MFSAICLCLIAEAKLSAFHFMRQNNYVTEKSYCYPTFIGQYCDTHSCVHAPFFYASFCFLINRHCLRDVFVPSLVDNHLRLGM